MLRRNYSARNSVLVALLLMLGFHLPAYSQASLLSEDTIDDITVQTGGGNTGVPAESYAVTLVRDAFQRDQWYYVPNAPRLYERTVAGKRFPEFSLIRYQFDDPSSPDTQAEGGILQFSATLSLPNDALNQIRAQLKQRIKQRSNEDVDQNAIRLSAMPLKSAEVRLYTPKAGKLLEAEPNGTGIAPTFASQKMVFSLPLTKIGADVYDALVTTGGTGVPVAVTYKYNGTTPPAGFEVTVNWDNAYRHYSSSSDFRAEASYWGLAGASYHRSSQDVFNELKQSQVIDVKIITGETFDLNKANEYLQPIIARINAEMLEVMKPPAEVTPAQAHAGDKGGFFGSANYAVDTKQSASSKHGTETFKMNVRSIVERQTIADGFIGIQSYPKEVVNSCVVFAQNGFRDSIFLLPQIGLTAEEGVTQISLIASARDANHQELVTKSAIWTPVSGWTSQGSPRTFLTFGLGGFGLTLDQQRQATFHLKVNISFDALRAPLAYEEDIKAFNGALPYTAPSDRVEVVDVDGTGLQWNLIDHKDDSALAVDLQFTSGSRKATSRLQPQVINGTAGLPNHFFWLLNKAPGSQPDPLSGTITFHFKGKTVQWVNNGDLRAKGVNPQIFLDMPGAGNQQ